MRLSIIYEDNHLLVVDKPYGMLTQSSRAGEMNLLDSAKFYLKEKYAKPGNVFLGMVHRLDRQVGGVVVFAKTSKAASRLSEQIRNREVEKVYLAVLEGSFTGEGSLENSLVREGSRTYVAESKAEGMKDALLHWRSIKTSGEMTLVEINLVTGRKHQIRAQFSSIGHPVAGDAKYESEVSLGKDRIALLSYKIKFRHPVKDEILEFRAQIPPWWPLKI